MSVNNWYKSLPHRRCSRESESHSVVSDCGQSMGFSRQEYWSRLPYPPPGDLPDPGIEPKSSTLAEGFFTAEPTGKPLNFSFIDMFKDFANTTHKIKMDFYFYCSGIFVFLKIGSISFWFSEVLPMVNP